MSLKKRVLAALAAVALAGWLPLSAEQLTTVAVVDSPKVYTVYFKDSQAVRDLERQKLQIQEELNKYYAETNKMVADRLEAIKQGNNTEALRLEAEITKRQQFYADYKRVKQQQLLDAAKAVQGDGFAAELAAAIKYVAESEGYSVVFEKNSDTMRFISPEIDITEKVIDYLKKRGR